MAGTFAAGEEKWRARLGTLRQVVRQHLVSRQLAGRLADGLASESWTSVAARAASCCCWPGAAIW